MKQIGPTNTQRWLRNLSWLGGAEVAAIVAALLGVQYIIARSIELIHNRA